MWRNTNFESASVSKPRKYADIIGDQDMNNTRVPETCTASSQASAKSPRDERFNGSSRACELHDAIGGLYDVQMHLEAVIIKMGCKIPTVPDQVFEDPQDVDSLLDVINASPSRIYVKMEELHRLITILEESVS